MNQYQAGIRLLAALVMEILQVERESDFSSPHSIPNNDAIVEKSQCLTTQMP